MVKEADSRPAGESRKGSNPFLSIRAGWQARKAILNNTLIAKYE